LGKATIADASHARGFAQHDFGIAQMLQRADLQHDVEAGVLEHRQTFVEVELDDLHAALHAGQNVGIVDFDAVAGAIALLLQGGHQRAVAATEVEHPRAARHEVEDVGMHVVRRGGGQVLFDRAHAAASARVTGAGVWSS